jgi:hypothetical protein
MPTRNGKRLPANVEIVDTIDGDWMVLVNGFQWGGHYDRSGAGNATFPTKREATEAYLSEHGGVRRTAKRKRAGAKKRTVSRLRASKRGRGYGVMRHGASTPSRVLAKNSYSAGPYSEYGPAHEKALRIESAGGRGMRIDKRRGGWYVSYVSPEALH